MQIKSNYIINENTIALVPAENLEFGTIVIEMYRNIKVRKTPLQLIKASCYHNWSTYEGRRQAVIHHTKFPTKGIYFFPSHKASSQENHWLSHKHIVKIKNCPTNPENTVVEFENDTKISLDVSVYVLEKQILRTFECIYRNGIYIGRD